MSFRKTNAVRVEELAAINGPIPVNDELIGVVHDIDKNKWNIKSISIDKPEQNLGSFDTSTQARQHLSSLHPEQSHLWSLPHSDMPAGKPWANQNVGEITVHNETVFMRACFSNNVDLAMKSVQLIDRPNSHDPNGNTLLMHAALMKDAAPMKKLLEKGADPDRQNNKGYTAAHYAVFKKDIGKVADLMSAGGKLDKQDHAQKSVLDYLSSDEKIQLLNKAQRSIPKNPMHSKGPIKPYSRPKTINPSINQSKDKGIDV